MLEKFHKLALKLAWIQPFTVVIGSLALVAIGYLTSAGAGMTDRYLIPAILLFCWCLLVFTLISLFRLPPPAIGRETGFFRRQIIRLLRFFRTLLALAFLVLTGSLFVLSYKLVTTGIG